ncbi:hypothetical protein HQ520_08680, partial [bacterium]|nr:hypothetical protein [bacterium]
GYAPQRGQAIYTRPGAPEDLSLEVTRFRDFYRFFRELAGDRVPVSVSGDSGASRDLLVRPFLDGRVLYVLVHNRRGFPLYPARFSLGLEMGQDAEGRPVRVERTEIKRLFYEGDIPEPHDDLEVAGRLQIDMESEYVDLGDLAEIDLRGEETCLVRVHLSGEPARRDRVTEVSSYSTDTLLEIEPGKAICLKIVVPEWYGELSSAALHLGLARDGGFASNPKVAVNGKQLNGVDMSWSVGVKDFHTVEAIPVPVTALRMGENEIAVGFSDVTMEGFPKVVSAKIVTIWESGD